ncbi:MULTISPECIES: hypothetical protein [Rhodococcus]|uniref:hypothetical protein n=1 Tax=Rhodococcus TaxID=1827 RepID=UPI00110F2DF7|nr:MULTISPECIES: hypothetical protein [Rhodococcus]MCF8786186.1 hypothetical protein [Rhodococcus ruber]UTM40234.1 hypothetical protein MX572_25345 [Rhodococcus pyridinivorans]WAL49683.1 hypothetical protein OQN32_27105 [Rhodococcus pyridinivorans]
MIQAVGLVVPSPGSGLLCTVSKGLQFLFGFLLDFSCGPVSAGTEPLVFSPGTLTLRESRQPFEVAEESHRRPCLYPSVVSETSVVTY